RSCSSRSWAWSRPLAWTTRTMCSTTRRPASRPARRRFRDPRRRRIPDPKTYRDIAAGPTNEERVQPAGRRHALRPRPDHRYRVERRAAIQLDLDQDKGTYGGDLTVVVAERARLGQPPLLQQHLGAVELRLADGEARARGRAGRWRQPRRSRSDSVRGHRADGVARAAAPRATTGRKEPRQRTRRRPARGPLRPAGRSGCCAW